jgi:hypothetical protein
LASLPLWSALNPNRLRKELSLQPKLAKAWKQLQLRDKQGTVSVFVFFFFSILVS